jgi:hypothetical protein
VRRALVSVLALVLLLAPVAPFAAVGGAAAAPAGMATIPSSNIADDAPAGTDLKLTASELDGGVMASQHADSLEVVLTTADHAPSVMDSDSATVSGDGMAVVLRDDVNSAGREVAIDAGLLQQALGYEPQAIYGTHEDGSEWTRSAEYVDGYLAFDVPHFSSNTVTFSGEVEISATGATNNTQFEYEIGDDENISDASLNLTGVLNADWGNVSASSLSNGDTIGVNPAGNLEPVGPSTDGEPEVVFTGRENLSTRSASDSLSASSTETVNVGGNVAPVSPDESGDPELTVTGNPVDGDMYHLSDPTTKAAFAGGILFEVESGVSTVHAKIQDPSETGDTVELQNGYGSTIDSTTNFSDSDPWVAFEYDFSANTEYRIVQYSTHKSNNDYHGHGNLNGDGFVLTGEYSSSGGEDDFGYLRAVTAMYVEKDPSVDVSYNQGSENFGYINSQTTRQIPLESGEDSIHFEMGGDGSIEYQLNWNDVTATENPSLDFGGASASHAGVLAEGETARKEIAGLSLGDDEATVGVADGTVDVEVLLKERTVTENPSVELGTDSFSQTITHSGQLDSGSTVDLSDEIDESLIGGSTTVTTEVDSPASGPEAQFDFNYSHSAQDKVSTTYTASTFEESYNLSHTYADATANAETTIPFSSSRVVGIKSTEYRVNGGNWQTLTAENYRFEDTTMTAYLADAYGSELPSGATVELRATARKISVNDGAVTVTDPTAPGEELDTQLYIDNRGQNFNVDVGPTRAGDRVHYAYADGFPTQDYVVIQADGSQKLYLPNSKVGDTFRVSHLDTRVVAERGDVRIDVVKAGENPELDVSPGPGGSGDPVTVEYYNTKTGVTYLLNSLTRSIVVDSDIAESPAIFEDDDSEDTWAILRDSGVTSSSSSSGAVGQFTERASGAVGSVSLPIDGSGLGQLALVGVLGLGGLLVLRRINPFGSSSSTPTRPSRSTASGSAVSRLRGLVSTAGSVGSRAAQTTGSGLLAALRRLLAYFGQVATVILGNRRASITAGVVAAIVAARVGLVSLPEGTGILIVVARRTRRVRL